MCIPQYKLLKEYNQPTTETANALAYAFQTIERLDYTAERFFREKIGLPAESFPSDLNGFFIRDDVDNDFLNRYESSEHPYFNNELTEVHSSYTSDNQFSNEMSQDMVWNLMVGLSLVKELVDDPTLYEKIIEYGEYTTLNDWAKELTYRMIKYMHTTGCVEFDFLFIHRYFCGDVWKIYNPVTFEDVHLGGDFWDLTVSAWYFAEAGNWITDYQNNSEYDNLHYGYNPQFEFTLPMGKAFVDFGLLALSTIANVTWARDIEHLIYFIKNCSDLYNEELYSFEHFPLMYLIFHGTLDDYTTYHNSDLRTFTEEILDIAPDCGSYLYKYNEPNNGQFSYYDDATNRGYNFANLHWVSLNRLGKPHGNNIDRNNPLDDNPARDWGIIHAYDNFGEYNGLDYMLLHNLYWLAYLQKYSLKENCNEYDDYSNSGIPVTVNCENTLRAYNTINSGANVDYTAGNRITGVCT